MDGGCWPGLTQGRANSQGLPHPMHGSHFQEHLWRVRRWLGSSRGAGTRPRGNAEARDVHGVHGEWGWG